MCEEYTLDLLRPGDCAVICGHGATGLMRRRLLDLGLVENTPVECVGAAPGGGLSAYLIRGAVIALRSEDSREIAVRV